MLRVYNFEFELIYIEPRVESTSWAVYYNQTGTFEAHLPLSSELIKIVKNNKYLIMCEDDRAAVLTGYEIDSELVLYGRTPNWLLEKRIAPKTESETNRAGIISNNIVSAAFSDVDNFEVLQPPQTPDVTIERSTYKTVYDAVCECLSICSLGHKLEFDTKNQKWIFSIIKGEEIPLLISESNKNAYDTAIKCDILDLADCGYYGEDGYLQGENSGIYRWETVLPDETQAEAAISLKNKKENSEYSLKLRNLRYGKDYNLGDILRIQITKGNFRATEKKRISGVRIVKRDGFSEEIPIFCEIGGTA